MPSNAVPQFALSGQPKPVRPPSTRNQPATDTAPAPYVGTIGAAKTCSQVAPARSRPPGLRRAAWARADLARAQIPSSKI